MLLKGQVVYDMPHIICIFKGYKLKFRILSNERDEYFTKLRMIEDELSQLKKVYQTQKKPLDRNEKLVLDRINSILHD